MEASKQPVMKKPTQTGDVKETIRLKGLYDQYAIDAALTGEPKPWAEWLDDQGFGLDRMGHVFKKSG